MSSRRHDPPVPAASGYCPDSRRCVANECRKTWPGRPQGCAIGLCRRQCPGPGGRCTPRKGCSCGNSKCVFQGRSSKKERPRRGRMPPNTRHPYPSHTGPRTEREQERTAWLHTERSTSLSARYFFLRDERGTLPLSRYARKRGRPSSATRNVRETPDPQPTWVESEGGDHRHAQVAPRVTGRLSGCAASSAPTGKQQHPTFQPPTA